MSLGQYDNEAGGQLSFPKCVWAKAGVDSAPSTAPFSCPGDVKEVLAVPSSTGAGVALEGPG